MPSDSNIKLAIPCIFRNRLTTTGLSQYFSSQFYVGEGPKAKAVAISTNGPSVSEKSSKSAQKVAYMHAFDAFW